MRRPSARAGFTLLEVVLAISLAVIVVGGAFAFYKRALEVRERVMEEVDTAGAERAIMDHITRELRTANVDSFLCPGMTGSAQEMRFATMVVPGPAAWAVRDVTSKPVTPERDLQIVGYRLRTSDDGQGGVAVDGLERVSQTLASAPTAEEGDEIATALVSARLKFLYLRYWDGSAWTEAWSGQGLPGAVEVTLGTERLPDGTMPADYPYATFRRVVFVPAGTHTTGGTVVRGLEGDGT